MKTVVISAEAFDSIVYLACATTPAKDIADLRVTSKVLDKLEEKAIKTPELGFKMVEPSEAFEFEDAEAAFVLQRIEDTIPQLQAWAAVKVLPVIDQLQGKEV